MAAVHPEVSRLAAVNYGKTEGKSANWEGTGIYPIGYYILNMCFNQKKGALAQVVMSNVSGHPVTGQKCTL